jgi:hypothetical protein
MKIISWIGCYFFNSHHWTVSKATGLNRKICSRCGHVEYRYDAA